MMIKAKVILEIARREVEQKIKEGILPEEFTVIKDSNSYSKDSLACPFDPAMIVDFETSFIVAIPKLASNFLCL